MEALSAEVFNEQQCTGLVLQFEAEATLGDPVRATAQIEADEPPFRVRHRPYHAETDRTLALAATTWRTDSS